MDRRRFLQHAGGDAEVGSTPTCRKFLRTAIARPAYLAEAVDSQAMDRSGMKCECTARPTFGETLMDIHRGICGITALAAAGVAWAGPGVPPGTPVGGTAGARLGQGGRF